MDISNRLPTFSLVEHLWSPLAKWYAHSAETSEGTLEEGSTGLATEGDPEAVAESCVDPETSLWYALLEEVSADGEPDVVLPDLQLADTIWQKRAKEGKKKKRAAAEQSAEDGMLFLSKYAEVSHALTACRRDWRERSAGEEGEEGYVDPSVSPECSTDRVTEAPKKKRRGHCCSRHLADSC